MEVALAWLDWHIVNWFFNITGNPVLSAFLMKTATYPIFNIFYYILIFLMWLGLENALSYKKKKLTKHSYYVSYFQCCRARSCSYQLRCCIGEAASSYLQEPQQCHFLPPIWLTILVCTCWNVTEMWCQLAEQMYSTLSLATVSAHSSVIGIN